MLQRDIESSQVGREQIYNYDFIITYPFLHKCYKVRLSVFNSMTDDFNEESFREYLIMIQRIINRLAKNSFQIKAWTATIFN